MFTWIKSNRAVNSFAGSFGRFARQNPGKVAASMGVLGGFAWSLRPDNRNMYQWSIDQGYSPEEAQRASDFIIRGTRKSY